MTDLFRFVLVLNSDMSVEMGKDAKRIIKYQRKKYSSLCFPQLEFSSHLVSILKFVVCFKCKTTTATTLSEKKKKNLICMFECCFLDFGLVLVFVTCKGGC